MPLQLLEHETSKHINPLLGKRGYTLTNSEETVVAYLEARCYYWRVIRGFEEREYSDQEVRFFDGAGRLRARVFIRAV